MSPTERLYLAAGDPRGAMALRIVVEGRGLPGRERLQAALDRAAAACPGSRLRRDGAVWTGDGPTPRVRTAPAVTAGPARPGERPGCELLVVRGADPDRTSLVFSASHAVMDGHGALTWVREVFRALRDEAPRPAYGTRTDHGVLRRLGDGRRRPPVLLDQRSPLGRSGPGPERTLWLRRTLPGRYPALSARLAQALTDSGGRPTRTMVPVDLRRHDPELAAATGNLTLPLFLDLSPGEHWAAAHADLLAGLAEGRELASGVEESLAPLPLPALALLLRTAQGLARRTDRHLASAVVSHLGRIDPADCSAAGFTAERVYALPVHAPLVPLSLVATETDTTTEITLGLRGGRDLAPRAARLLDDALARLGTAAAPKSAAPARAPAVAVVPDDPAEPGSGDTVVSLFRARAARDPQAVALDGPAGPVTYGELDRRSDAVAAELHRRGVGREDLVGLVVDRTPGGVTALWGVLKAGAAYVPLDPAHPGPRTGEVLHEAGVRLCLTERHLRDTLAPFVPGTLLAVEDVPDTPAPAAAAPPGPH
ncbi:AMP-binding protein, partial [Streptomyces sp. WAC06614]|uniref:AMP-binding protein n=1 Tax=Streptomyces sp. WAC06614 TaxID=2487416 RepID=UPI000F962B63